MNAIGGRNFIFPRFHRHAFIIAFDAIEAATMQRIFTSMSEWHFGHGYSDKIVMLTKSVAMVLCAVHEQLSATLRPTPSKFHYLFSLRDVWRAFQGICLVPPKKLASQEKLIRLWAHETYRVYADRFTSTEDNDRLLKTMNAACKDNFKIDFVKAMGRRVSSLGANAGVTNDVMRTLVFGNFMEPDAEQKSYDEIDDWTKLEKCVQYYLNEYNAQMAVPMGLVLFRFGIEHISRISRALQLPQGHCLIVGQSGSGRRSAIRLAVSMTGAELFVLHASTADWREMVKRVLIAAGTGGKMTVLLYTCASDGNEDDLPFLDDIVTIMNCCELPNLFQSDERAKIIDTMQAAAKESVNTVGQREVIALNLILQFPPLGGSHRYDARSPIQVLCRSNSNQFAHCHHRYAHRRQIETLFVLFPHSDESMYRQLDGRVAGGCSAQCRQEVYRIDEFAASRSKRDGRR